MKALFLEPDGGMGNRISQVKWGVEYIKAHPDFELKVFWDIREDYAARFEDVFEPISDDNVSVVNHRYAWGGGAIAQLRQGSLSGFFCKVKEGVVFANQKKKLTKYECHTPEFKYENRQRTADDVNYELQLTPDKSVGYSSVDEMPMAYVKEVFFFENFGGYGEIFKFNKSIVEAADAILAGHSNVIGVHIRRGDSDVSIANNPIEIWEKRMQEELDKDSSVVFYVATDDMDVMHHLQELFPGKILQHPSNNRTRNSKAGIVIAAEEILVLANCRLLLGSLGSSFSRLAQFYKNTKTEYYNISTGQWEERY